jgi:hypothetical protein
MATAQEPADEIFSPVYDPDAHRYFALVHADRRPWADMWDAVAQQAQTRSFKGVRGRLAIVDSAEVHSFLLHHFPLKADQYAWIGLRYLCRARKLEWSDGHFYQQGTFQAWNPEWKQDVAACAAVNDPKEWAPVAYAPASFTWIVKGQHKGYDWYYIEFPTGHP